jgi:hypothetical protein
VLKNLWRRNITIVEDANFELRKRVVLFEQALENMAGCIDPIPFSGIDSILFESQLCHILNRKRCLGPSMIVVEH